MAKRLQPAPPPPPYRSPTLWRRPLPRTPTWPYRAKTTRPAACLRRLVLGHQLRVAIQQPLLTSPALTIFRLLELKVKQVDNLSAIALRLIY